MAGCLIGGRHKWSVTYTSPLGLHCSEFGIEGHLIFCDEMKGHMKKQRTMLNREM